MNATATRRTVRQVDRIEWIRDLGTLNRIERPWRALEARVDHRSHVSAFDFLAAWYRHYAGDYGGEPLVGLAWQGDDLAGVAPLTLRRGSMGRIPVVRIDFAPTDSIAGEFLAEDDHPGIVGAFVDSLVESGVKFDVMCLNGFDPASGQLASIQQAASRHRLASQMEDHACATVDLRRGYDAYRLGLSAQYRRKLNQKAKRIASEGHVIDGIQPGGGADRIEETIARMIAITEASYKLAGQRLADCHRNFLADVARRFHARGLLSLPVLSIAGRDAAFIMGIVERGCFYDVSLAYDEAFAKVSPGAFLMQCALQQLAALGIHTVISHGAHEYKRHWSTAFVPQKRVFLFASSPRGTATRVVRFGLRPLWRRLTPPESETP
jgi:CelD/BcsL family acetyltransferase involved in cellulose biosynthesis